VHGCAGAGNKCVCESVGSVVGPGCGGALGAQQLAETGPLFGATAWPLPLAQTTSLTLSGRRQGRMLSCSRRLSRPSGTSTRRCSPPPSMSCSPATRSSRGTGVPGGGPLLPPVVQGWDWGQPVLAAAGSRMVQCALCGTFLTACCGGCACNSTSSATLPPCLLSLHLPCTALSSAWTVASWRSGGGAT
jgi:hypothetical protein